MSSSTPNQERAICARGNVLVQAGAGAGKTRTLVRRCVKWLREDNRNSLDQILMVTFTEAAAAEMRQRIRAELHAALEQRPDDHHLAEELALLQTANISTLHSFCLQLVRQHFYELGLDPQVAVLADEETRLLADEVLTNLLQRHYARKLPNSSAVQELIQVQGRGWDKPIRRLVLRLHEYTKTLPDPARWFHDQLAMFGEAAPRQWEDWLREFLPGWSDTWLRDLQNFQATPAVAKAAAALQRMTTQPVFSDVAGALAEILQAGDRGNTALWPRGSIRKIRQQIRDFFEEAEFLQCLTSAEEAAGVESGPGSERCPSPLREDWNWSREPMITLLQLTQEFDAAFADTKRELGAVDFHDLEQFSLRLLRDSNAPQPAPLAEHWQRKLRLIFVDEYQDINAAQDAILRALAREGRAANRFLVGDVKQSIYRFRLADPHIFQSYIQGGQANGSAGEVIPLQDNFRSHEAILEFINLFFAAVMRKEMGGVAFGPDASLLFGNRADRLELTCEGEMQAGVTPNPKPHVELHLCLTGSSNEADAEDFDATANEESGAVLSDLSKADKEARIIGLRLREMRAQPLEIWDVDLRRYRPADWRDMVILLRSRKNKVESFAKEFARLAIPLAAARGGFFESAEIMDLLNLLKLLDNPLQDLETIAVLRSPLVGLTVDELATIRLAAKGRFWTALQRFYRTKGSAVPTSGVNPSAGDWPVATEPGARTTLRKVERFLKSFNRWRRLAREGSLSHCLEEILNETHYSAWLLTQPRGEQRQANIPKLLGWARQFDQFHRQGLFRFLRLIEAQRDAEIDREPAPAETENAVRLMSIHQSKGLEFPVVVVADLGKTFNLSDLRAEIILDEKYGVCPQIKPPFTGQRYPSLPHWLAQRRQRTEALGEEMRILYVALTRACHTLLLAGTTTRQRAMEEWPASAALRTRSLLRAKSCLDWLGPWLPNATGRADWLADVNGESKLLCWRVYAEEDPRFQIVSETKDAEKSHAAEILEAAQIQVIRERLNWRYPFAVATTEPAKASVSGLRRRVLDEIDTAAPRSFFPRSTASEARRRSGLSPAEIGTAHHLFLQFVSLDEPGSISRLEAEADRLEQAGILGRPGREALDLPRIAAFWQSQVGRRMLANRDSVHRELPFTARFSGFDLAKLFPPEAGALSWANRKHTAFAALPEEFIVVQGVVDLAVVLPTEIWFLDFKTDEVNDSEWLHKARAYGPQLKLYLLALGRIYRRPVTNCWLHFLALDRTVECTLGL